jgi:YD repeat-containing protein
MKSKQANFRTFLLLCALCLGTGLAAQVQFEYSYDDFGRLIESRQVDGTVLAYAYDTRGNLTEFASSSDAVDGSLWAGPAGDKSVGIGWINDALFPFIWHYSTASFFFIAADISTLDSLWGYDYGGNYWFWCNDAWGGWYFNLTDPSSGFQGYSNWNQ